MNNLSEVPDPLKYDRVLYVGYLWRGSTCVPRLKGLRASGLHVEAFDATAWAGGGGRVVSALAHRLYATPGVWTMNGALIVAAGNVKPDVVWIEKGNWVYPSTLKRLRDHARYLLHYNTDDVFGEGGYFWLHHRGIKLYDLHLTTNRWNVLELRQRYGVRTMRVGMGYDQDLHRPSLSVAEGAPQADVLFVGHWEPHTERFLVALRESGVSIRVFGHGWGRATDRRLRRSRPLPHAEYVETVASARMALCTLSRRNRNESTGRSFEIPAIGTFLLAERTLEHEYLYGDGSGVALFTGEKELVEKTHRFLAKEEDRRAVAAQGHARCISLGLSWGDHMRREMPLAWNCLRSGAAERDRDPDAPFWPGFREGDAAPPGAHAEAEGTDVKAAGG